jgi:hypothetical protein
MTVNARSPGIAQYEPYLAQILAEREKIVTALDALQACIITALLFLIGMTAIKQHPDWFNGRAYPPEAQFQFDSGLPLATNPAAEVAAQLHGETVCGYTLLPARSRRIHSVS